MKPLVAIVIMLVTGVVCYAQAPDSTRAVSAIARAQKNKIMLRWGVTDPVSWQFANKYGYRVDRYTIMRNGRIIDRPTKEMLTGQPLKPAPQSDWEKIIDTDDFAAIAAQAIFGDSFNVQPASKGDVSLVDMINRVKEMEQRFSFALFAADHSYSAAMLSGLALTDSLVKPNEKYFYKIYATVPRAVAVIDTAYVYIGLADYAELPQPTDVSASFSDRAVRIAWPVTFLRQTYVSYSVERSDDDGKTFRAIDDKPYLNTYSGDTESDHFTRLDSVDNNRVYHYRVRGTTPFGEPGPPSEPVKGMGIDPLSCAVGITSDRVDEKTQHIVLQWSTECNGPAAVQGYDVQRSSSADGAYETLHGSPLPADILTFTDLAPRATNYYRVVAIGANGQRRMSYPRLVQLEDSIPPAAPQPPTPVIDSTGIVRLTWQANTDTDLLGYRVFRSNFSTEEYAQITAGAVTTTAYTDTINLKTLTRKIYYKIAAVDKRFNMSAFSTPVAVIKPDVVPPVPPVFKEVKAMRQGVFLAWAASPSEDVKHVLLSRKHKYALEWTTLAQVARDSVVFMDKIPDARNEYQYRLVAVDDAGNQSTPCPAVWGKRLDDGSRPPVLDVSAEVDRTEKMIRLRWVYTQDRVSKYVIYRAQGNEPLSMYKSVPADRRGYADTTLTMNTSYTYRVKALFLDGAESAFSDPVNVEY